MNVVKLGLATYRLTKLALDDEITREAREKIYSIIEGNDKLEYLATCPWCLSVYAGIIVVALEETAPQINSVLASSGITGLIYSNLG